jgi:hypothetical protein
MNILAILLVVLLVLTLAASASGKYSRLAWEVVVTLTLVLLLIGSIGSAM